LTDSCKKRKLPVNAWRLDYAKAMNKRGEYLGVFDIKHEKPPTLAQITLQLSVTQDDYNNSINAVDWIADGIKAENDQWVLNFMFLIYSYGNKF
jgi:hypothetical protein